MTDTTNTTQDIPIVQTLTTPTWPISECFGPVSQGEGVVAGQRTMFVRFGFCDGPGGLMPASANTNPHCTWCDSMFSVDPKLKGKWRAMAATDIVDELGRKGYYCHHVTLTGGNPLLHDLTHLITALHGGLFRYTINVETQGTIYRDWVASCDTITLSPKPPSARQEPAPGGEQHIVDGLHRFIERLARRRAEMALTPPLYGGYPLPDATTVLKVVVDPDNPADLRFAHRISEEFGYGYPLYLSCLTRPWDSPQQTLARYAKLEAWAMRKHDLVDVRVGFQIHTVVHGHGRGF